MFIALIIPTTKIVYLVMESLFESHIPPSMSIVVMRHARDGTVRASGQGANSSSHCHHVINSRCRSA
jgi:hypothetical protein